MNIVDMAVLILLGISVLIGMYRGFIASVASLGGCFLSLGISAWMTPKLAAWVQSNSGMMEYLRSVIKTRIGDLNPAGGGAAGLQLPGPLKILLQENMQKQVFGNADPGYYVSQTIISAILSVLCYLACFLVCLLVLHLVINFLKEVFKFPVLKQLNAVMGGVFGLLRGVLLCFLAFALLPLVQTMVEIPGMDQMISGSTLAPLFNWNDLVVLIMRSGQKGLQVLTGKP